MKYNNKIEDPNEPIMGRLTNANLVCKDCIYRMDDSKVWGNTTKCKQYADKPSPVIAGEECIRYTKET